MLHTSTVINYLVARVDSIANEMESFIQDFTVNLEK